MQKETYFYPSSLKNIKDFTWKIKNDTEFLWIIPQNVQNDCDDTPVILEKLIQNPKVLNISPESVSILEYTGREKFHDISNHYSLKKVVFMGVNPQNMGISFNFPLYTVVRHSDFYFLKIDGPQQLESMQNNDKIKLAKSLTTLKDIV